jgi:tRNA pseudouridine55 synthase
MPVTPPQDVLNQSLSGAFWILKPEGLTSSDVVVRLKKALTDYGYFNRFPQGPKGPKISLKIGHGGTLDPFATGVMVILVGEATKLADTYLHSTKTYTGTITMGSRTDTADLTGQITEEKEIPSLSQADWQKLADTFTQDLYLQTPPMYSAKKQNGQSLHSLARQGIEVERKAILKKIFEFQVTLHAQKELRFRIKCESGTYVRVIAEDLAQKAGTVAHLKTLERVQSSDATFEHSLSIEAFFEQLESKKPLSEISNFRPISKVASHLPSIVVDAKAATELKNGIPRIAHELCQEAQHLYSGHHYVLIREKDSIIALLENQLDLHQYRLQRVIHP